MTFLENKKSEDANEHGIDVRSIPYSTLQREEPEGEAAGVFDSKRERTVRTIDNRSVHPGALRTPAVKASSLRRQSLPPTREDKDIIRRELGC